MPKNAIIVGMPRSGTSMTTSIFVEKGYFIANNKSTELRQGDEHNPSGYWEAEPLIKSNAEIFNEASFPYDNTWLYEPISLTQANKIYTLSHAPAHKKLLEKYNNNTPWVWKDPRLCYTLAYWWPLVDKENTRVLLLIREPKEIYQSFTRLKWRAPSSKAKKDVYLRIQSHIEAAQKAIKELNIPYIEVNYSDFKEDPVDTAKRLSVFFDFDLKTSDIPYSHKLNHSTVSGRLVTLIDRIVDLLPNSLRKILKSLTPTFIFNKLFPYRKK